MPVLYTKMCAMKRWVVCITQTVNSRHCTSVRLKSYHNVLNGGDRLSVCSAECRYLKYL